MAEYSELYFHLQYSFMLSLPSLFLFVQEKQEWWWIYVTDRRKTELITPPQQIFNLKDEEKVEWLLLVFS